MASEQNASNDAPGPDGTPPARRSLPRRMLNRLEVDRAVFYALSSRLWQALAGPVSMVLIARFFTPDVQGYYYTFASLLGLQVLVELGLQTVLVNVASHEWAHITAEGATAAAARTRLASLARHAFAWYAGAALVFAILVGTAGYAFFNLSGDSALDWERPWLVLVVLSALSLATFPAPALLEGCGRVTAVQKFRLLQGIVLSLTAWTGFVSGAMLWTAPLIAAVKLLTDAAMPAAFGRFFRDLMAAPGEQRLSWSEEVWPLQWRLAVQSALGYFAFNLYVPVMFHYHGPHVAGQMGMTWTALFALHGGALAWVQTRAPLLASLAARRDFRELDRVFFRVSAVSLWLMLAGAALLWGVVWLLYTLELDIATRVLPPLPTLIFLGGSFCWQVLQYEAVYVRAHKQEPFLGVNLLLSLSLGMLVWGLGARHGALGAAVAYLASMALLGLPAWTFVWLRFRREWRRQADALE